MMAGLLWYRSYMDSLANTSGYYPDIHAGHADRVTELTLDAPYLVRETPAGYNQLKLMELVGGSVAWNQLAIISTTTGTVYGITRIVSGGSVTYSGNASSTTNYSCATASPFTSGHKWYITLGNVILPSGCRLSLASVDKQTEGIFLLGTGGSSFGVYITSGFDIGNFTVTPMAIDLTACLGSTIADYVYSLEQATAGSGIAWLKSYGFFTEDYYAYSAPTLQSVEATSHVTKDANDTVIATYPLDSDLVLRGIPKLSNGNLYYDGDTYEWDGTVTRKYAELVADGSNIYNVGTLGSYTRIVITVSGAKYPGGNQISDYLPYKAAYNEESEHFYVNTAQALIFLLTSKCGSTVESVASYLQSNPFHIIYELAAPTTESADPFTAVQTVEDGGTEKFVTTNGVPVGNVSIYRRA